MLEFRAVCKKFGEKNVVLRDLDLEINRGEIHFLVGASGVGKSVTIKLVIGLLRVDSGQIWLDGQRIDTLTEAGFYPVRKKCAMVFQNSTLFDSMSVVDNVALPLRKHQRLSEAQAQQTALNYLREVGMDSYAGYLPATLSDGMRKRVAIARAMTLKPEVLLFDEPTTGLDPVSARRVDDLISTLGRGRGITCVVVSHDLTSIRSVASRISLLYQGRVRFGGTPTEFEHCDDPIVTQFRTGSAEGPMETPGY